MNHLSLVLPSPIEQLSISEFDDYDIYIKREDLIQPEYGGNKWRKLKYNLIEYQQTDHSELITFGGAFSNHIAATARVCHDLNIPNVGIIRGKPADPNNPTLIKAQNEGMNLHFVTRAAYREKENSKEIKAIIDSYKKPYLIPEGGANSQALKGIREMAKEIIDYPIDFDHIIVAAGTGTTASGILQSQIQSHIHIINVLKNPSLKNLISQHITHPTWTVHDRYHFGGFAKTTDQLISFINNFSKITGIRLDQIYNGKAMYALFELIKENIIEKKAKVLFIHTGGLQGITAYNYLKKKAVII